MKSSTFKLLIAFTLFICSISFVFSQEKKILPNDALWIKSKNIVSNSNQSPNNIQSDLKTYFNFNPIVDFSKDKIAKEYKKLVTKNASVFVVFKSTSIEENGLISLERGVFKASLSNQKIVCDKEVLLNKGDSKKGLILSYLYNKNSLLGRKKGKLIFNDLLFDNKEGLNQFAELIYIPRCVSTKEKEIIESYLSIKYGISLNEGQNYYNSKKDTLWNSKESKIFNRRITGIGKDELLELNQKQSKNSIDDGLTIGLTKIAKTNAENDEILNDKDFVLWADNDKTTLLEKSDDVTQKRIKRIWKVKTFSESNTNYKTQIRIEKALMLVEANFNSQDTDFMWLAIEETNSEKFDYKNAKYIKATINDEKEIVFDSVEFLPNSNYLFTIVKAKVNPNILDTSLSNILAKKVDYQNSLVGQYKVYPNPINANEKFTIQFNLKDKSKVSIQIADINGKIIKTKDLGLINNYSYAENLSVSGTYLIMIYVNEKLETSKLIVN